jgi:hypothetical protein
LGAGRKGAVSGQQGLSCRHIGRPPPWAWPGTVRARHGEGHWVAAACEPASGSERPAAARYLGGSGVHPH